MHQQNKLYEPESLQEALMILAENKETKIIAGGTDLLLKHRHNRSSRSSLVSIRRIEELSKIERLANGDLVIGSMVSFNQLHKNPAVSSSFPILSQAAFSMGGPQIRNMATIGGNLCNGATSADSAPALLALQAVLVFKSSSNEREVPIEFFYKGLYDLDIEPQEILTSIRISPLKALWGGYYTKFSMRNAMDISTLGCAAVCSLHDAHTLNEVRISLGTAAPTPIRCYNAEKVAQGKKLTEQLLMDIGCEAIKEASPRSSWRASKEYRMLLIKELTSRTVRTAFLKAGGKIYG
jgi:xanthine dehydrogenase FAD-binding subunit